jgi:hypothetical protein
LAPENTIERNCSPKQNASSQIEPGEPAAGVQALLCPAVPDPKAAPGQYQNGQPAPGAARAAKEPPPQAGQFSVGAAGQSSASGNSREQTNEFLAHCCPRPINPGAAAAPRRTQSGISLLLIFNRLP